MRLAWYLVKQQYAHNSILLHVHELIVRRGLQHDDCLEVLRRVVEHYHAEADLLALPALVGALHFYEEREYADVLQNIINYNNLIINIQHLIINNNIVLNYVM